MTGLPIFENQPRLASLVASSEHFMIEQIGKAAEMGGQPIE
jgi:hypothetical protein